MRFILPTIALVCWTLKAHSEYRAFELRIDNTEEGKSRTVISSLDNYQYPRYYPLEKKEVISYVDSWMCFENMSDFRRVCAKPADRGTASTPANTAAPKPNSP